jgi:hypothetical protein
MKYVEKLGKELRRTGGPEGDRLRGSKKKLYRIE